MPDFILDEDFETKVEAQMEASSGLLTYEGYCVGAGLAVMESYLLRLVEKSLRDDESNCVCLGLILTNYCSGLMPIAQAISDVEDF